MGFFKKKSPSSELIDFTEMYKRGLMKKPSESTSTEVVDMGSSGSSSSGSSSSSASSDLGFLSNLAGAGDSPGPVTSGLRVARKMHQENAQVNEMKLKLEDNEYKIRKLHEKVKELDMKIRNLEERR